MKQAAAKTTHSVSGEPLLGAGSVALTFLDTTWRIATPVVLFTVVGIAADLRFGTKPWLTLPSVVIGFVGAALLIKRQLEAVSLAENNQEQRK
jgi:hypothetical protein